MASGLGLLAQHARESCLQPTETPGQLYLRCECGLDEKAGVQLLVRLRDGFAFNGPIPVSAAGSWHRDEHPVRDLTPLGTIDSTTPIIFQTVQPGNLGVHVLPGSHFYLHVYFDLALSSPPSAAAPSSVLAAIADENLKLSKLQGEELRAHICNPLLLPYCRNLEFVYKVARLRHDALYDARERDRSFELETTCDYLQSGLCDRLQGPQFEQRRQELSKELASLRSQHSPIKRPRTSASPAQQPSCSWSPTEGESVMYRDDQAQERPVTVLSVLHNGEEGTPRYKISWLRQTERRKLAHCNGSLLKAKEVDSLRPGYNLVYNGYDVTVSNVLRDIDNRDDDGVPRLEIEITRITTKVSRLPPP